MITPKDVREAAAVVIIETPVGSLIVTRPLTPEEWRALAEWAASR